MILTLKNEWVDGLHLTESEARLDMAIGLYAEQRVTLGRAAKIAGLSQADFLRKLGSLQIPIHYELADLEADLRVVREAQ